MDIGPAHRAAVLRLKEVQARVGLSRSTIYELIGNSKRADPSFPRSFKISNGGSIGFLESQVESWILQRSAVVNTPTDD